MSPVKTYYLKHIPYHIEMEPGFMCYKIRLRHSDSLVEHHIGTFLFKSDALRIFKTIRDTLIIVEEKELEFFNNKQDQLAEEVERKMKELLTKIQQTKMK